MKYAHNNLLKRFSLLSTMALTALTVSGCGSYIPDTSFSLTPSAQEQLEMLGRITVEETNALVSMKCVSEDRGWVGYILVSGNGDSGDDYSKWGCGNELLDLNCPDFIVTPVDGLANVSFLSGLKSEYSREDVLACVNTAIKIAPTEIKPKDARVKNADSWD